MSKGVRAVSHRDLSGPALENNIWWAKARIVYRQESQTTDPKKPEDVENKIRNSGGVAAAELGRPGGIAPDNSA